MRAMAAPSLLPAPEGEGLMASAYENWKRSGQCGNKVPCAYLVCILPWHADNRCLFGRPEDWFPGGTDSDDWRDD